MIIKYLIIFGLAMIIYEKIDIEELLGVDRKNPSTIEEEIASIEAEKDIEVKRLKKMQLARKTFMYSFNFI